MKKYRIKNIALIAAFAVIAPISLKAQEDKKGEKGDKGTKEKIEKQHIIVTTKGEQKEKIVIEISGDKVTVNGKPIEEYKDKNGDISVNISKLKDLESLSYFRTPKGSGWSFNTDGGVFFNEDENRAMLGVTTEKTSEGVEIQSITKESAAEKAGLKEHDIITKVGDKKIESPDDLSETIKNQKPGDKVSITYLREKKEHKVTAELTKWKGVGGAYSFTPGQNFNLNMDNFKFDQVMPKIKEFKTVPGEHLKGYAWSGSSPKLGLSVQDTDDGKGVKVVNVDDESNAAKAGIKEDDIITHVDDKAIKSVDEISALLKEKKDNPTVRFQLTRGGKSQNIEVKMPRKIKTTNL